MSEAEMTLIMKLFDKSPLLVMCVFLYFGFVVPQRKKATEDSGSAKAPVTTILQQYDDVALVHSIGKLDDRIEAVRQEIRVDLATAKSEILDQVSRLDGIVTRFLLDDRQQQNKKGH